MKSLITFFILAYIFSWFIWCPLYSQIFGWNNLPILHFQHALGGLGPLFSSFVTTWIFEKKEGVMKLWKSMRNPEPIVFVLVAFFSPFILAFLSLCIAFFVESKPIEVSKISISKEFPQFNFLTFFVYNLVFFGFGEEVGWRGFALPRLQRRYDRFLSSFILAIFWGVWHWPLFFYRPGFVSMDLAGALGWGLSLMTGSVLLSWFYNSSKGNLLVCAIFHSTVDIVFLADFANRNITSYMGILITVWGLITIFLFQIKKWSFFFSGF